MKKLFHILLILAAMLTTASCTKDDTALTGTADAARPKLVSLDMHLSLPADMTSRAGDPGIDGQLPLPKVLYVFVIVDGKTPENDREGVLTPIHRRRLYTIDCSAIPGWQESDTWQHSAKNIYDYIGDEPWNGRIWPTLIEKADVFVFASPKPLVLSQQFRDNLTFRRVKDENGFDCDSIIPASDAIPLATIIDGLTFDIADNIAAGDRPTGSPLAYSALTPTTLSSAARLLRDIYSNKAQFAYDLSVEVPADGGGTNTVPNPDYTGETPEIDLTLYHTAARLDYHYETLTTESPRTRLRSISFTGFRYDGVSLFHAPTQIPALVPASSTYSETYTLNPGTQYQGRIVTYVPQEMTAGATTTMPVTYTLTGIDTDNSTIITLPQRTVQVPMQQYNYTYWMRIIAEPKGSWSHTSDGLTLPDDMPGTNL